MELQDVVVTGVGPVSAIGNGREGFWGALCAGTSGFGPITLCETEGLDSAIAAEVEDFELTTYLPEAKASAKRMPRMVQFALAAGAMALEDAGLDLDGCGRDRVGVHVGTSIANIGTSFEMRDAMLKYHRASAHTAFYGFNHSAACLVSATFDLRGPLHTASSGCNSGLDALGQAAQDVRLGEAEAMLVVGADCELVPEIVQAMCKSRSLATKYNDNPAIASRALGSRARRQRDRRGGGRVAAGERGPRDEARGAHLRPPGQLPQRGGGRQPRVQPRRAGARHGSMRARDGRRAGRGRLAASRRRPDQRQRQLLGALRPAGGSGPGRDPRRAPAGDAGALDQVHARPARCVAPARYRRSRPA